MTTLNVLIIMFLLMIIIIMASFITHKTNELFLFVRAMILTVFILIVGGLFWIDLFV
ncbi:hypothetical protein [Aliicoccus persicus]|uniref:Uncharacterized protein n=1 Tax=Aliicoccus persicus TaxID=930138 RepID=A0A662Z349_9STAP|nr:hypothetical protein [Aliicoccus persicus]SEW01211.1 hypothetical protein SAMN05192557_1216 [Aliicoccus persicus]